MMKTRMLSKPVILLAAALITLSLGRAQNVDRSRPPAAEKPKGLSLPPVERFKLANGIEVVFMEKHSVPLVEVEVILRTGAIADPKGKEGLANLTTEMLTEGAGSRSALELDDAVDFLGADLNAVAGFHTTGVSIHVPTARLDSALAILADVVRRPKFPQAELDRKKKELSTTFTQWRDEPRMLASLAFNRTVYGDAHPYGRSRMGTQASVACITVSDLQKFHSSYFAPSAAMIIVAGDVGKPEIASRLEKHFGTWKGKSATVPEPPAIHQIKASTLVMVDKPGAPQSVITIGRVGVPRTSPDYYAIAVMNTLLGGSFSSRLNLNLREKHGYTYGAGSRFDFRPLAGPFAASASVQTEVTDKSLTEFMNELNAIVEDVTDDEVSRAKNYVALGYPADFQSVGQLTAQLGEVALYNLPADYFNNYIGRILAVTKDDVLRAAKKYIDPKNMAIIVVGDMSAIEEGVKGLELAPEKVVTIDDLLGSTPESNATK
jgi:zinc protease